MAKKTCDICGKEMGLMTMKIKLSDGCICDSCFQKCGFEPTFGNMSQAKNMTLDNFKSYYATFENNREKIENFTPTQIINEMIKIDDNSKTLILANKTYFRYKPSCYTLFNFDQIIDFELLEDGESIASGGLGRAAVGALTFGAAGAVLGGITGKKKTKGTCTSMEIKITVKGYSRPTFYIKLINSETKKDSLVYKATEKTAQDILSALQLIVDTQNAASDSVQSVSSSSADEIRKFKELLDDGIITEEEFNSKKKELLGF